MAQRRKLEIELIGDSRSAERAFRNTADASDRMSSRISRGGLAIAAGFAGAAIGAAHMIGGFISAAEEAQQVTRQTEAVIESMGASSFTSAGEIADLAEELSLLTGIDDEVIQSGENVMLTFGNVQEHFERATEAALDMSVALGTDLDSAAMRVGVALNDPIKGVSKLTRAGIQFTEQQVEQIAAMQEAGDIAGAQAIMLEELERQFGGSAEAQATASDKLSVAWGNIQEQLGEYLLPIFESVATWLAETLPVAVDEAKRWIDESLMPVLRDLGDFFSENLKPAFDDVVAVVRDDVIPALGEFINWITENEPVMWGLVALVGTALVGAMLAYAASAISAAVATIIATWPFILLGLTIAGLIALFVYLYNNNEDFRIGLALTVFIVRTAIKWLINMAGTLKDKLIVTIEKAQIAWTHFKAAIVTGMIALAPVWSATWSVMSAALAPILIAINALVSGVRWLIDNAGRLSNLIPSGPLGGLGGLFERATGVNIPGLAAGGIVQASPGGTIVRLGEGGYDEMVTPLDGSHRTGSGDTYVFDFSNSVITKEADLDRAIARSISRVSRNGFR